MRLLLTMAIVLQSIAPAMAQTPENPQAITYKISERGKQLEMVVNSSRIIEMEFRVPRVLVENPAVLGANPISPTQIQLAAKKPGVTHVTLWDENGKVHSLDVIVIPDARELEYLLKTQFPEASLKVRPLASSVAISGYCPSAPMVSRVVAIASDYYPKVINNIEIGGAQQVLLHVKVLEVSRTKLRTLGVDWALFTDNVSAASRPSGLITGQAIGGGGGLSAVGSSLSYGIVSGTTRFFTYLEALRRNNLLKVMSEPTLTTVSGRAASFNVGGEFPILVPQSLGTVSIEYRQFGTRVDFVPIVRSNGEIRLEVRPQVSEIDASRSVTVQNSTIPGLRSRWVDTAAEMRAGQTLALAGLLQNRIESETRSIPVLGDLPGVGAMFRRVQESNNEVELLILVTPELVEPMDKHEVPPCGPGQFTKSPSDGELYGNGWLEVPKCCPQPQGTQMRGANPQQTPAPVYTPETVPAEVLPGQGNQATPGSPYHPAARRSPASAGRPVNSNASNSTPSNNPAPVMTPQDLLRKQPAARTASYSSQSTPTTAAKAPRKPGLIGPSGYDAIR